MDFLIGFAGGFVVASALTVGWYHGSLKPKIEAMKVLLEAKLGMTRAPVVTTVTTTAPLPPVA